MSYIVEKGKSGYNIQEKGTSTLIELERSESEVRTMCRKMNLGSGFNGWTPIFFTKLSEVKYEEA
jgi:hypothetical protein